jgi:hypothetical protein
MSRVYPSIQGCPFRKIVKREIVRGMYEETLSCGHLHVTLTREWVSKRRCYRCKDEIERGVRKR